MSIYIFAYTSNTQCLVCEIKTHKTTGNGMNNVIFMLIVYRISDSRSVPNQWYASKNRLKAVFVRCHIPFPSNMMVECQSNISEKNHKYEFQR